MILHAACTSDHVVWHSREPVICREAKAIKQLPTTNNYLYATYIQSVQSASNCMTLYDLSLGVKHLGSWNFAIFCPLVAVVAVGHSRCVTGSTMSPRLTSGRKCPGLQLRPLLSAMDVDGCQLPYAQMTIHWEFQLYIDRIIKHHQTMIYIHICDVSAP